MKDNSSYLNDGQELSYIDCGNDPSFDIETGSFSISSWIYLNDRTSSDVILSKASVNTQNIYSSYDFRLEYGSPTFTTTNDNGSPNWYTICKSSEILDKNKWYHLVAIGDTSTQELRLYINAQLSHSVSWNRPIHGGQYNLLIGSNWKSNFGLQYVGNFNGKLDEVGLRLMNQSGRASMDRDAIIPTLSSIDWLLKDDGYLFLRDFTPSKNFALRNHHYKKQTC